MLQKGGFWIFSCLFVVSGWAVDISKVPLWDGETVDCRITENNRLSNRFGGNTISRANLPIFHTSSTVHSGDGGFELTANIAATDYGFAGMSLTGFGPTDSYFDTRDLTHFQELELWLKNETGESFDFDVEVKDYRDINNHRAIRTYPINGGNSWQKLSATLPCTASNGWAVIGAPDFSRTKLILFVVKNLTGSHI